MESLQTWQLSTRSLLKTVAATLLLASCMNVFAGLFGFGGTSWKEEVQLSDGRIIVIEREQINEGGGDEWAFNRSGTKPKEFRIRFEYPDGAWIEEPLPEQFEPRATNLFFGNRKDMPSLLNPAEKDKRNSGSGYRQALKQVGPTKKVCG